MIIGVGTDMASVSRIAGVLEEHGDRFIRRCFAEEERARVESRAGSDPHLRAAGYAKRWAAKEACAKALGSGIRDDVFLKDIVVINGADGAPALDLRGGAKDRLTALTPQGMTPHVHVSLSDESATALAFVVISAEQR
jgi:holo-[acyl-carrier protein] synthase